MIIKKIIAAAVTVSMTALMLAGCGGASAGGSAAASAPAKAGVKVVDVDLTEEEYAFGVDKDQPELLKQTNAFIARIMEDGTFDRICDKYFGDGEPTGVSSSAYDEGKEQLVVAVNAAFEPFEYMKGELYYGIDMEIAQALADELNQELVIQNMDFDAVCLSVGQHKCDIAMSGLTIKPEREEYVTFTDPYYQASQRLIVRSDNTEFDSCADAAAVEKILRSKPSTDKVGVQNGTTGQFYCEGDADWGFEGFEMETVGYKNGSMAVQDLLNGNINYVVIDKAPAEFITEAINAVQ